MGCEHFIPLTPNDWENGGLAASFEQSLFTKSSFGYAEHPLRERGRCRFMELINLHTLLVPPSASLLPLLLGCYHGAPHINCFRSLLTRINRPSILGFEETRRMSVDQRCTDLAAHSLGCAIFYLKVSDCHGVRSTMVNTLHEMTEPIFAASFDGVRNHPFRDSSHCFNSAKDKYCYQTLKKPDVGDENGVFELCVFICPTTHDLRVMIANPEIFTTNIAWDEKELREGKVQELSRYVKSLEITKHIKLHVRKVKMSSEGESLALPASLTSSLLGVQKNALRMMQNASVQGVLRSFCGVAKSVRPYGTSSYLFSSRSPKLSPVKITNEKMIELESIRGAVLALPVGTGKTLVILVAAKLFNHEVRPNLVVVPDLLFDHWQQEALKHGLADGICFLQYSKKIPSSFVGKKVVIATLGVLRCQRYKKIGILDFHTIFVDEAHQLTPNSMTFGLLFGVDRIFRHNQVFPITATIGKGWGAIKEMIGVNQIISMFTGLYETFGPMNDAAFVRYGVVMCDNPTPASSSSSGLVVPVVVQNCIMVPPEPKLVEMHRLLSGLPLMVSSISCQRVLRLFERVTAGGHMDLDLYLAILKRLFDSEQATSRLIAKASPASQPALCASNDECCICLNNFSDPVQTVCHHVFCRVCLEALFDLSPNKRSCPLCRKCFGFPTSVWDPVFQDKKKKKKKESVDQEKHSVEQYMSDNKTFQKLLNDDEERKGVTTHADGKLAAFKKYLSDVFIPSKVVGKQLVIFSKRGSTSREYIRLLNELGLPVLCAGVEGVGKKVSCANVEAFKKDGTVLFCSYKFSTGIDIPTASHQLITDLDTNMTKVAQAVGRITRIGQKHLKVFVTCLVYDGCFDDWLYTQRFLNTEVVLNISTAASLEWFTTRLVPGTRCYELNYLMTRVIPRWSLLESSFQSDGKLQLPTEAQLVNARFTHSSVYQRKIDFYDQHNWVVSFDEVPFAISSNRLVNRRRLKPINIHRAFVDPTILNECSLFPHRHVEFADRPLPPPPFPTTVLRIPDVLLP